MSSKICCASDIWDKKNKVTTLIYSFHTYHERLGCHVCNKIIHDFLAARERYLYIRACSIQHKC